VGEGDGNNMKIVLRMLWIFFLRALGLRKFIQIGWLKKPIQTPAGKLVFISQSAPFKKKGKKMVRTCRLLNEARQAKKAIMLATGMSGKQVREWLREMNLKYGRAA
jgi:hypothetical protein